MSVVVSVVRWFGRQLYPPASPLLALVLRCELAHVVDVNLRLFGCGGRRPGARRRLRRAVRDGWLWLRRALFRFAVALPLRVSFELRSGARWPTPDLGLAVEARQPVASGPGVRA